MQKRLYVHTSLSGYIGFCILAGLVGVPFLLITGQLNLSDKLNPHHTTLQEQRAAANPVIPADISTYIIIDQATMMEYCAILPNVSTAQTNYNPANILDCDYTSPDCSYGGSQPQPCISLTKARTLTTHFHESAYWLEQERVAKEIRAALVRYMKHHCSEEAFHESYGCSEFFREHSEEFDH